MLLQVWGTLPWKVLISYSQHILMDLDLQKREKEMLFSRNFCFLLCTILKQGHISWGQRTQKIILSHTQYVLSNWREICAPITDETAPPKLLNLPPEEVSLQSSSQSLVIKHLPLSQNFTYTVSLSPFFKWAVVSSFPKVPQALRDGEGI